MVSREQKIAETKLVVEEFLKTKASDIELAKLTGLSATKVGTLLHEDNKEIIVEAFPGNGEEIYKEIRDIREKNLERAKILGSQMAILNNTEINEINGFPRLLLEVFFKDETKQKQFLFHIALTYRAKLPLLSELFQIEENELYEILKTNGGNAAYGAVFYLLEVDDFNQEIARRNILELYKEMLNANKNKDKETRTRLIKEVTDFEAAEFQKKWSRHLTGEEEIHKTNNALITEAEIEILVNYQLKYALTDFIIAEKFGINRSNYRIRVRKYLEDKPELKARYETLLDRNNYDNRKEFGFIRG